MFYFTSGSWLQTSYWYKYKKSVEPLFAYSFNRGSSKTFDQEQTMNAHADMPIVVKHNEKYIPRGIYRFLALGYETLQDFNAPKQAPINAFLLCLRPSAS